MAPPASTAAAAIRPKPFYIPSLDGIRGCAFLLVFMFHAFLNVHVIPGFLGVTVFFFLSGYLITTLMQVEVERTARFSLKDFYIRRALRILPPMYLVYASAYLLGKTGIIHQAGNMRGILATGLYCYNYATLLSRSVVVPTGLNVIWSIMVEEHFYLLFPFLYFYFLRRHIKRSTQSAVLFALCMVALLWRLLLVSGFHMYQGPMAYWTYYATDCRFDSILWGCLLAVHNNPQFAPETSRYEKRAGRFALAGFAIIIFDLVVRNEAFRHSFRLTFDSLALYPIFYFCVRFPDMWAVRILQWQPLRYLGWISFTMYLSHDCFLSRLHELYPNHPARNALFAFSGALVASWVMRQAVERPIQRLRGRLRGGRASSARSDAFLAPVT